MARIGMKLLVYSSLGMAVFLFATNQVVALNHAFPSNIAYPGCIRPDHVSTHEMHRSVADYYAYWKARYLRLSNGNTPGGGYYIKADSTGGHTYPIKSNSEAHGYGMLTFVLMAGYDAKAKAYFDGMFNMYDQHRSTINGELMSWLITQDEYRWQDSDSATDGDFDIAYALLLAHDQWGSGGGINYLKEAKRIISRGIKPGDMSETTKRTMLGDWDRNRYSTRSSDWMAGHMRAFHAATQDSFWLEAADVVYDLIEGITASHSPATGLMPDFVVGSTPRPAPPGFLEGPNDGLYYYNACRFPWRLALDAAHNATPEARNALNRTLTWLKAKTGANPANIRAGYTLAGGNIRGNNYFTTAFASPLIAASVISSDHQRFLNAGWDIIKNRKESYYGDSINLLCMLFISGNWWAPGTQSVEDTLAPSIPAGLSGSSLGGTGIALAWKASTDNVGVNGYEVFVDGVYYETVAETNTVVRGLFPNTTYFLSVTAFDAAGNTSYPCPAVAVTTEPEGTPDTNVALGKRTVVSSIEGSHFVGARAVDGSMTTRWASLEGHDPEWIYIDLGTSHILSKVILFWEAAYAKNYALEVSEDAVHWQKIHADTAAKGGKEEIAFPAIGRYVRLFGIKRGTPWGYSLYEFEIYGKKRTPGR